MSCASSEHPRCLREVRLRRSVAECDAQLTSPVTFSNSTRPAPSGSSVTGCADTCYGQNGNFPSIQWIERRISTVYAETLLVIVNNRTNATRTSTITNPQIVFPYLVNYSSPLTPSTTDSAGTVTTSVVMLAGGTVSTRY